MTSIIDEMEYALDMLVKIEHKEGECWDGIPPT